MTDDERALRALERRANAIEADLLRAALLLRSASSRRDPPRDVAPPAPPVPFFRYCGAGYANPFSVDVGSIGAPVTITYDAAADVWRGCGLTAQGGGGCPVVTSPFFFTMSNPDPAVSNPELLFQWIYTPGTSCYASGTCASTPNQSAVLFFEGGTCSPLSLQFGLHGVARFTVTGS